VFDESIHAISATDIRKKMREEGKLGKESSWLHPAFRV
jgi:hypothetical protein